MEKEKTITTIEVKMDDENIDKIEKKKTTFDTETREEVKERYMKRGFSVTQIERIISTLETNIETQKL